jgi:hypothetical protein
MRLAHIGQYIAAMWSDWLGRMSSTASVIFIIIALIFKLTDVGQARYWIGAAFACYAIASFRVWYKTRPDLKAELQEIFLGSGVTPFEKLHVKHYLTIVLFLVNTRSEKNAIKDYELVVEVDGQNQVGQCVDTTNLLLESTRQGLTNLDELRQSTLEQGQPKDVWTRFAFDLSHDVKDKNFILTITDVYDVSYKIKGKTPPIYSDDIIMKNLIPDEYYRNI